MRDIDELPRYDNVLHFLTHILTRLGHWGYLAVFLAATLESAAFLGLLVPGESIVLIGGFLASRGILDVGDLIVIVTLGAVLGDSIGYELGHRLGRRWLLRHGHRIGVTVRRLHRVDGFFARHGGKTVFLARFVGFLRALAPFVAGSSRMRYRQFLPYNILGGLAWSTAVVLLGFFLGESWSLAEHWIGHAAAVVAILVAFAVVLAVLWGYLSGHELEVRQWWSRVQQSRYVVAARRRFGPQLAFARARFSPGAYLGLHLTLGVLVLITAAWIFGAIAEDVVNRDPLTRLDAQVALWFEAHSTPRLNAFMLSVTRLGSTAVVLGIVLLTALLLLRRKQRDALLALILTVPGGLLLNSVLKLVFHRTRPDLFTPIVHLSSFSFPSGHTMGATVLYGFLAAFGVWTLRTWRWRVFSVVAAAFVVSLIGFSRIYLRAHYLSDVLGALAEGLAWLALCLTAVDTLRRRRRAIRESGSEAPRRDTYD